jgi:hypothetical protein
MGETIDANSIEENANGPAALKTKAEIVQYLKDSFALGHRAISGVTSENEVTPLPKPVTPFLSTRLASRPRPQQQQSSQPKPQK